MPWIAIEYKTNSPATNPDSLIVVSEKLYNNLVTPANKKLLHEHKMKSNKKGCYLWKSEKSPLKWQSPTLLPRICARYILNVNKIWIQRLSDITEDTIFNMGIDQDTTFGDDVNSCPYPTSAFKLLWDKKYGNTEGLATKFNPFLWACTATLIKKNHDHK